MNNLSRFLEHTALQPDATKSTIEKLCIEALSYNFFAVVVNPVWVRLAHEFLFEKPVKIVSVAGFPLGANRTDIKVAEAVEIVEDGAHEVDMVANISWLCDNRFSDAEAEIRKVRRNLRDDVILKVIIETNKLTAQQQQEATRVVISGGAQFVKTCTGFFGGATVEQVKTLTQTAGGTIKIKASGGIRTLADCQNLIKAGASRIGSSKCVEIVKELLDTGLPNQQ